MKKVHLVFIWMLFAVAHIYGQCGFVLGKIDTIQSSQLHEQRILNIYLPEGYPADSTNTYPVIYLLDGSANEDFVHIVGVVQFLNMIDTLSKVIVVGVANVDRKRDFTFPTSIAQDKKDYPTTGGSEKFIDFIEKDLQPYIEKKYRTSACKTLIGQSLGGLVATEILLKKPLLFSNYCIVSPSLWWDNESLLSKAPDLLKKLPGAKMQVYIAVGNEGTQMENDAKKLDELLQKSGTPNLKTTFLFMPDENHLTILHNSIYKGLEILSAGKQL